MGLFDFFKKKETDSLGNPIDTDEISNEGWDEAFTSTLQVDNLANVSFKMTIDDIFTITGRGTVVTGTVEIGSIKIGDKILVVRLNGEKIPSTVTGVEMFRKLLTTATVGDNIGLLLRGIEKGMLTKGDVIIKP